MEESKIERIISIIRDSFDDSIKVYTQGSCIRFAMLLKEIFPEGTIMYNSDHAVFEYEGKLYDITGEVGDDELNAYIDAEKYYDMESLKQYRYI